MSEPWTAQTQSLCRWRVGLGCKDNFFIWGSQAAGVSPDVMLLGNYFMLTVCLCCIAFESPKHISLEISHLRIFLSAVLPYHHSCWCSSHLPKWSSVSLPSNLGLPGEVGKPWKVASLSFVAESSPYCITPLEGWEHFVQETSPFPVLKPQQGVSKMYKYFWINEE